MTAYYNEFDPYAAEWLRNLIREGLIAPGDVDERSIVGVEPNDLRGYTQCHFFAGIGGWSLALRMAGWSDERPVWTGSCPCQPFSSAGRQGGERDERHLWPEFQRLVAVRRPPVVFGEQVASKLGRGWLAGVRADLEALGYAVGAADLCAASVGAPHIRQRLWWVADAYGIGYDGSGARGAGRTESTNDGDAGGLAYAGRERRDGEHARLRAEDGGREPAGALPEAAGRGEHGGWDSAGRLGHADEPGPQGRLQRGYSAGERAPWAASMGNWLPCADGKARRIEPGLEPLAHGVSNRVGRLRAYGNAIVPEVAAAFIRAYAGSA